MTIAEAHKAVKLKLDKTDSLDYTSFLPEEIDFWINQANITLIKTRYSGTNPKRLGFEENQKRTDDLRILVTEVNLTTITGLPTDRPNSYNTTLPTNYWFRLGEEATISYPVFSPTTTKRVGITEMSMDRYRDYIDNPFGNHIFHNYEARPLRLFIGNIAELISDGQYSVDTYHLTYLRKPQILSNFTKTILNGSVEVGKLYKVIGTGPLDYNYQSYTPGQSFYGVIGQTTYQGYGLSILKLYSDFELPDHLHDEIVSTAVNMMIENIGDTQRYQTTTIENSKME